MRGSCEAADTSTGSPPHHVLIESDAGSRILQETHSPSTTSLDIFLSPGSVTVHRDLVRPESVGNDNDGSSGLVRVAKSAVARREIVLPLSTSRFSIFELPLAAHGSTIAAAAAAAAAAACVAARYVMASNFSCRTVRSAALRPRYLQTHVVRSPSILKANRALARSACCGERGRVASHVVLPLSASGVSIFKLPYAFSLSGTRGHMESDASTSIRSRVCLMSLAAEQDIEDAEAISNRCFRLSS